MTIEEIKNYDRDYLVPAQVASVLGCDPHWIRVAARNNPEQLGFKVCTLNTRIKIPRISFLKFMGAL